MATLEELESLAERAVALIEGDGQVTALWTPGRPVTVAFTCVEDGRAARVEAAAHDQTALERAARAARLRAGQARAWPSAGLPAPRTLAPDRDAVPRAPAVGPPAARIAIASTRGVRAAEELTSPPPSPAPAANAGGGTGVVLGPRAVAAVLDRLRSALGVDLALGHGPLAGRIGHAVAAPCITLRDDARITGRRYDAEGMPREPVLLIEGGTFRSGVHDTASAARTGAAPTGHATQPATLAPMPDHLVLGPGDAPSLASLAEGCAYQPDPNERTHDPLDFLARADALTRERWLVPLRGHAPGGAGAALVPAVRLRT